MRASTVLLTRSILALAVWLTGCDSVDTPSPSALGSESDTATISKNDGRHRASRVEICHRRGQGRYRLKSVPAQALAGHLRHGDARPGDPVPDDEGLQFDTSCRQVDACPCFSASDILSVSGIDGCFVWDEWEGYYGGIRIYLPWQLPPDLIGASSRDDLYHDCWAWNLNVWTIEITRAQAVSCRDNIRQVGETLGLTSCNQLDENFVPVCWPD